MTTRKHEQGLCRKHGCHERATIDVHPERDTTLSSLWCNTHWNEFFAPIVASGNYYFSFDVIDIPRETLQKGLLPDATLGSARGTVQRH